MENIIKKLFWSPIWWHRSIVCPLVLITMGLLSSLLLVSLFSLCVVQLTEEPISLVLDGINFFFASMNVLNLAIGAVLQIMVMKMIAKYSQNIKWLYLGGGIVFLLLGVFLAFILYQDWWGRIQFIMLEKQAFIMGNKAAKFMFFYMGTYYLNIAYTYFVLCVCFYRGEVVVQTANNKVIHI